MLTKYLVIINRVYRSRQQRFLKINIEKQYNQPCDLDLSKYSQISLKNFKIIDTIKII